MKNKKITILLCDDEKDLTDTRKATLTRKGFNVLVANDGNECLEILKETVPDVLILDIKMPGKRGLEVLEKIRRGKKTKNLPVIINSVHNNEQHTNLAEKLNVAAYFPKPYRLGKIIEKINEILGI